MHSGAVIPRHMIRLYSLRSLSATHCLHSLSATQEHIIGVAVGHIVAHFVISTPQRMLAEWSLAPSPTGTLWCVCTLRHYGGVCQQRHSAMLAELVTCWLPASGQPWTIRAGFVTKFNRWLLRSLSATIQQHILVFCFSHTTAHSCSSLLPTAH